MSGKNVLVTGGGGFIGSYLVPELCARGHRVAVVDNLLPQTPGDRAEFSPTLKSLAVCVNGDVRDPDLWQRLSAAFPETEVIVHLAAWAGTGQSAADVRECESVNSGGTAAMLGTILDRLHPEHAFENLRHVVLSSSTAVYGEGAYSCTGCASGLVFPAARSADQLAQRAWGFTCRRCGSELSAVLTPEGAPKTPTTLYGATMLAQEHIGRVMALTAGLGLTILRIANVFGPGQRAGNPYSGELGRFCAAILDGRAIELAEDGQTSRDFVYISDAVDALAEAVEVQPSGAFNMGSGTFTRVAEAAHWLCGSLDREVPVVARATYRVGDVRHMASDLRAAREAFGFAPKVTVQQGLQRFSEWVRAYSSPAGSEEAGMVDHVAARQAA